MPFKEIKFRNIIFDPKVQTHCVNPNFQCPSYDHSWACPPVAPYLEQEVSRYKKFYLIYVRFDLNSYITEIKEKHPNKKEEHIRNAFFMKNLLRDRLEKEIFQFLDSYQDSYEKRLILWDGFCRICFNKKDKGCTYDSGEPCRYPDKKRYSMEAVGIEVTKTVKNLNLDIEWPPLNHAYRFGLICFQ